MTSNTSSSSDLIIHDQYIHVTGTAFVIITPGAISAYTSSQQTETLPCTCHGKQDPKHRLPQETICAASDEGNILETPGFLWIPNHLLTKKWRSGSTGDEKLHDALLADFTKFCKNEEDRLQTFVQEICEVAS